jgi:hypothetical protein
MRIFENNIPSARALSAERKPPHAIVLDTSLSMGG